ncbi:hypothetical protein [Amycolatopsis sp. NPDC051128]|uniref:hypothetical protein n=1 Tax=Amycolatopsis sp. NPDC051128 TaxID=3155412 RepID=UPI0034380078
MKLDTPMGTTRPKNRRWIEAAADGLDFDALAPDLTELLAGYPGDQEFPMGTGLVHDELADVADLLPEFDAVFEAVMANQAARAVLRTLPGRRAIGFVVEGEAA